MVHWVPPVHHLTQTYAAWAATVRAASGGTIGILIPPSVILVLYGILTETSISDLFMAGVVPGILTVIAFMATVSIVTRINPELGPRGKRFSGMDKLRAFKDVWGTVLLFLLVIGGIYLGIFTPIEAAGIGATGALSLAALARRMSFTILLKCLMDTVRTTSMIFTILIGAIIFNNFLVLSGVPDVPLGAIYLGVLPFVLAQILLIALLIAVPALALWLPQSMG